MISGIIAFIQMLPRILMLMEKAGKAMSDARFHAWLEDLEKTIDRIEAAHTSKEKQDAAQSLARSIHSSR
jgi:truncated hemoglobin YjbI